MTENLSNIPQINELLFTLKLSTGEELLCTLIDISDDGYMIEAPLVVRTVPVYMNDGSIRNELSVAAWLPFSANRIFMIPCTSVLTYGSMVPSAHAMYVSNVNRFDTATLLPSDESFIVDGSHTIN